MVGNLKFIFGTESFVLLKKCPRVVVLLLRFHDTDIIVLKIQPPYENEPHMAIFLLQLVEG